MGIPGKSTWLKQHYSGAVVIDLLAPEVFRSYSARPERLREVTSGAKSKTIIIDEVQKIPEFLDVVHALIEEGTGFQFILTGSSGRKLKRTGVDLLAGRAIVKTMHPFMTAIFSRRAKRHLISHPKFYYFDRGVFRSLRPTGPLDSPHEIDGAGLEGVVAQHLRDWIAYSNKPCDLSYWRTKAGIEVDFVLYGQDTFWAIEVKNSAKINGNMLKGLLSFREDYPEARAILLYRGHERLMIKEILCLPCEQFLRDLAPGQPVSCKVQGSRFKVKSGRWRQVLKYQFLLPPTILLTVV